MYEEYMAKEEEDPVDPERIHFRNQGARKSRFATVISVKRGTRSPMSTFMAFESC